MLNLNNPGKELNVNKIDWVKDFLKNKKKTMGHIKIKKLHTISFQNVFKWAFRFVVDSWELGMLLLYILWDDRSIFMISASNELQQEE